MTSKYLRTLSAIQTAKERIQRKERAIHDAKRILYRLRLMQRNSFSFRELISHEQYGSFCLRLLKIINSD